MPRLWAAGADLTRVRTLDDGEYLEDFASTQRRLAEAIIRDDIGLVVFDQLIDHVPGGSDGQAVYNPKHVRQALMPLRRVSADCAIATLGLLHPIKGNPRSFRELIAGSHQFNAVSRSSLLLGVDPEDEKRRLLVRGKGNHSAVPRSFEFTLAAEHVELNTGARCKPPKGLHLHPHPETVLRPADTLLGMVGFADFDRYVEEHGIPEEHCPAAFALWIAEVAAGRFRGSRRSGGRSRWTES